jgi:hypothetical protein
MYRLRLLAPTHAVLSTALLLISTVLAPARATRFSVLILGLQGREYGFVVEVRSFEVSAEVQQGIRFSLPC